MARLVFLILTGLCLAFSTAHAQQVKFVTTMGDITVEVDADKAPITTENFLRYVRDGHYDGTLFHRVINGFVLQGAVSTKPFNKKRPVHPFSTKPTIWLRIVAALSQWLAQRHPTPPPLSILLT